MKLELAADGENRRIVVLALVWSVGFLVILFQLVRYQVFMHSELQHMASEQRSRLQVVDPPRGRIADYGGQLLTKDTVKWDVSASPELVTDPDAVASQLASILGMPRGNVYDAITSEADWIPLASGVPRSLGRAVANLQADGIIVESSPYRQYPQSTTTAHVLGFVNWTGDGFYGVEGYHNSSLKGITGTKRVEVDPFGVPIPIPAEILLSPTAAMDLALSLDLNIQRIAQQELGSALERFRAESGTVIIMDPNTGTILANFSLPAYDPNDFVNADSFLLADPSVSSMWEPGHIFEIITWSAGLDAGLITPDMVFHDEGRMEVGGLVIENSDGEAHGEVTMTQALGWSLNTAAAHISTSLGQEDFYAYLRRFGFGELTGVDLAAEGPGRMKSPGDGDWFPSELGTNSFGQGIAVTPMQMIAAVAAIANQGQRMRPFIVQQLSYEDGSLDKRQVNPVEPRPVTQVVSRDAAAALTAMLVEVYEQQVPIASVPGYRIAGKSGTAQIPTAVGYHPTETIVSFVGYAPADDPRFVILIKLDRPKTSRWGSHTAAPTFKAIAEKLFVYLQIPPDEVRLTQP